jgi:hypothetical protein
MNHSDPCTPDCDAEYRCSCGRCQPNCVCALGDPAQCPDAAIACSRCLDTLLILVPDGCFSARLEPCPDCVGRALLSFEEWQGA